MKIAYLLAASALAFGSTAAMAKGPKTQTVTVNGAQMTFTSKIIGQTSTGTIASGGDPRWLATNTQGYSGVAGMLMRYDDGSAFVCSGTLTGDTTFVTAGHCVSDGGGIKARGLVRTQIVFVNDAASLADTAVYQGVLAGTPAAGVTAIDASYIKVNANYTGEVIDQNDIALIRLSQAAPAYAQRYGVYYGGDLTGVDFNVAGFGTRSTSGGVCGTATTPVPPCSPLGAAGTGRRRQGDNRYDFAWGDADFGGTFTDVVNGTNFFGGTAQIEYSFLSDFDNGTAAQDASCNLWTSTTAGFGQPANSKFCNLGRGLTEANIAGGDSGGPGFVDGKLASVNSYGGPIFGGLGDIASGNNSSWGEFAGYVPTYIHQNFIQSFAAVPEPSQWAMMLGGFGLLGGAMRRRKAQVTFA
jgi:hypothetical protein